MPKFITNTVMQFGGLTRRAGVTLEVSREILDQEIAKGLHRNGKPNSGLLNHCSPADDETAELCKKLKAPVNELPDDVSEEDKKAEIEKIMKEMDEMGKSYDRRWGVERFRKELLKAQKETGN